jgi:hypothetical protein
MKKVLVAVAAASLLVSNISPVFAQPASNGAVAEESSEHPRIAKAINDLEDAIAYMEKAPHNFGGHKAAAIESSKKALKQLRAALAFRAKKDGK